MEENQNSFEQIQKNIKEQDKSSKKGGLGFKMGLILIIVGVIIFLPILVFLFQKYENYTLIQKDKIFKERLRQAQQEEYEKAMADTYGGKTPAETLQMYIEAIEKGDYELASKYFIEPNREEELKSFTKATKENIDNYLKLLKSAHSNILKNLGSYSFDKNYFIIYEPIGISMKLYPNGIWKIIEI
jgi:hypothetical protein